MRITLLLTLLAVLGAAVVDADHPTPVCGVEECTHKRLESDGGKTRFPMMGAAFITKMEFEASEKHNCAQHTNRKDGDDKVYFGVENTFMDHPKVFVDGGCEGLFNICFLRGTCESFTLSYMKPNITLENRCIKSMYCFMKHTEKECRMDHEFTFYNNFARTNGGSKEHPGCDCQFLICHVPLIASDHEAASVQQQQGSPSLFDMTGITANPNGNNDLRQYNAHHVKLPQTDNGAVNSNGHPHV